MTKRILSFILILTMLVPLFSFSAYSAKDEEEPTSMYTEVSKSILFTENNVCVENFSGEKFVPDNKAYTVNVASFRNKPGLFLTRSGEGDMSVTVTKKYKEALDLSSYNELYFQVSPGRGDGEIKFAVTLHSGNTKYTVETSVKGGAIYDVYFPLAPFDKRDRITGISLSFEGENLSSHISVSSIFADTSFTYSYRERFTASDIYSTNDISFTEKSVLITPLGQNASVSAVIGGETKSQGTALVAVRVSGVIAGNMTLSVISNSTNEYTNISTLTLFPGSNTYTFMYDVSKGTHGYSLTFSGITADKYISLDSVYFNYFDRETSDVAQPAPGAVSSCALTSDGKSVRIAGTLQSSTVINNISAKIGVAATDMWGENETPILDTIDISTVFEIKVPVDVLSQSPYLTQFRVYLVNEDSKTLVATPIYPAIPSSLSASATTVLGVQSRDTSVPFRSNVSQSVVDVDITQFKAENNKSVRSHLYNGQYYYYNSSVIEALDSNINFLVKAGVDVLLRIVQSDPTGKAVYTMPSSDNTKGGEEYKAVLDYLTSRYSDISGVIVGSRIDNRLYNYSDIDGIYEYCKSYVRLLRITSAIVRKNTKGAAVIAPVGDPHIYSEHSDFSGEYSYNSLSRIGEMSVDPAVVTALISHLIAKNGSFQWYVMYECESDPATAMNTSYKLYTLLTQSSGTSPQGHYVLWQPESITPEEAVDKASLLISESATLGPRGAVISLIRADCNEEAIADSLKVMSFEKNSMRQNYTEKALLSTAPSTNNLSLWDFTSSFTTGGFIGGGSITKITTESSGAEGDSKRVLRAATDEELGNFAIALSYFEKTNNLAAADSVNITMRINSARDTEYPVTVLFGKDNIRYEYTASVSPSETVTLRCPINKEVESVLSEYLAVSVTTEESISFDILKIEASGTLPPSELKAALTEDAADAEKDKVTFTKDDIYLTVFASMTVVTLIATALFSAKRKQK